jgi:acyl-coenzyme A synthetase/AMP-(fatty) acid ligase
VVGMLAHSGIPYVVTIVALNRLGYTSFLVSPRLASPALKQLLDLADCHTLLTTESFHRVIGEVQKERDVIVKPMLVREDYDTQDAPAFRRQYDQATEAKKVAVIIHSSGSTGLPKPIYLTNQSCIAAFAIHMDMRGFIAAPMFHSNCFYETFRAIYSRKPLYYCNFAIPLTRQNLIDMVDAVKPEIFHVVPYTIKLLAESDAGIDMLARMKLVLFSGSACPDALGKRLVERGVNLVANYGA